MKYVSALVSLLSVSFLTASFTLSLSLPAAFFILLLSRPFVFFFSKLRI